MKILAIETSCDDTGIAILEASEGGDFNVLSNIVASQTEMGKKYGGVYPAMAKREHQKNILPTLIKALKEAKLLNKKVGKNFTGVKKLAINKILEREPELAKKLIPFLNKYTKPDIDFISVTNGPGLEPCLWVGVNFAKALSYVWNIPVVPVNHIEGHILVNFLENKKISLPAVALVVSGGHTQIILMKGKPHFAKASRGTYKILGETRDDAAGECFDKCAKILGLGYPGGPIISKLAEKAVLSPTSHKLPRPMINTKDYDFSFSGLKTAVLYAWQKIIPTLNSSDRINKKLMQIAFSVEIQQAIIDVLIKKTMQAAKDYKAKTIILGGGVSANHELKTQLFIKIKEELPEAELLFPEISSSTDNGLMIAIAGYFNKKKTVDWKNISADGNLRISD